MLYFVYFLILSKAMKRRFSIFRLLWVAWWLFPNHQCPSGGHWRKLSGFASSWPQGCEDHGQCEMPVSKVSCKQWCQERSHVWRQRWLWKAKWPGNACILQSIALAIRTRTSVTPMLTNRSSPVCYSGTFIVALATTTVHFCCPVY